MNRPPEQNSALFDHVPLPVYDAEPGFVADTDEPVSRWYVRLPEGAPVFTEPMSGAEMKAKWPDREAAFRILD